MTGTVTLNSMIIHANVTIPKTMDVGKGRSVTVVRAAHRDQPVRRARLVQGGRLVPRVFLEQEARLVHRVLKV